MKYNIIVLEDMIDELEDLAYNRKTDLLNAKRHEISIAIKSLYDENKQQLCIDDIRIIINSIVKYLLNNNDKENLIKYRMVLDWMIEND